MGKSCEAFLMDDVQKAWEHMDYEIVKDYGDRCNGHFLHTWDEGKRLLGKCKNCGGYVLVQRSEFHGMDDDYYRDYFPVSSPEEAAELNRKYDGFAIEKQFEERYLKSTNGALSWSK